MGSLELWEVCSRHAVAEWIHLARSQPRNGDWHASLLSCRRQHPGAQLWRHEPGELCANTPEVAES
eukprot:13118584-Alexandrium_andersonii.AAC.1